MLFSSRIDVLIRLCRAMADPSRARMLDSLHESLGYPARLAHALELTRFNVPNRLVCAVPAG